MTMTPTTPTPGGFSPKNLWLSIGALLLVGTGVAAGMALSSRPQAADPGAGPSAALAAPDETPAKTTSATSANRLAHADTTRPAPRQRDAPPACASCGVVDSITTVEQRGEGTGAGAVVGGVLGGVVGHQMGGGNGNKAMTVLGAIGGGLAGNEVEKRSRAQTVYNVTVRMDDGSLRTVTMSQAQVARGDRVSVDGSSLRRLDGGAS